MASSYCNIGEEGKTMEYKIESSISADLLRAEDFGITLLRYPPGKAYEEDVK